MLREDGANHYIDVRGLMFSDHTFESRKNWEYHELVACKFYKYCVGTIEKNSSSKEKRHSKLFPTEHIV